MPGPTVLGVSLKMYLNHRDTVRWSEQVATIAGEHSAALGGSAELFVLPSFPAIPACLDIFAGTPVRVGAQDLAVEDGGAYTGEVSGAMLAELGCTHAEVGHAERRRLYGESDSVVAAKAVAALRNGLIPVMCVGEPERTTPEQAATTCIPELSVVVDAAGANGHPAQLIVAYEPQWAIGASEPASADHIAGVCRTISGWLADQPAAAGSRVIYGGSAGPGLLTRLGDSVDGLFLGRFAHDPNALKSILDEVPITAGVRA
jgi:triosephosphate isomerase